MSRPEWGTAPIKCGNRKCDWTGTERDLIHHPDDAGKFSVRNVCPKCHADSYTFTRRKRVASCQLVTETLPPNAICSKWWDSAHEALELHRQLVKERLEP